MCHKAHPLKSLCSFLILHDFDMGSSICSVSGMLVKQMGNVWFCCGDANGVCNRLGLCRPSKDPSLQFRDNRPGLIPSLDAHSQRYFLIVVIVAVTSTVWFATFLSYLFDFMCYHQAVFTTLFKKFVIFCCKFTLNLSVPVVR